MKSTEYSSAALAYLGDSVIEVMTRQRLVETGMNDIGLLNRLSRRYVQATAQSDAVEKILPLLTEEELAVYKRGRNAHTTTVPKSANAGQYRRATGMETLFAFLYLEKRQDRMNELYEAAFGDVSTEISEPV